MRKFARIAFCLSGTALSSGALAQDGLPGGEDSVIIVTAQNRAQDLQDVPIKIDVIDGDDLLSEGFSSANDLSKIAPVAQVQQDQGTVRVYVRGVGTNELGAAQDTSVVANIDGEYINRPAALGISIFDLDRVEVLRGPQGTLYGRNATAGAVNFIARKPADMFGGNASVSYGNFDSIRADAGVDLPIGPGMGFRAAGFFEDRDGYTRHPAFPAGVSGGFQFPGYPAGRSDDNNAYGGRLSFLADDMDNLTFYVAVEYAERHFTPQAFGNVNLNEAGNGAGVGCSNPGFERRIIPSLPDNVLCVPVSTNFLNEIDRSEYVGPANGLGDIDQKTFAIRSRLDYEFGPAATLSYIAGYREFDQTNFTPLPGVYSNYGYASDVATQSHELRLAGEFENGIIYQVGGFYFKETQFSDGGFYLGSEIDGFFLDYNVNDVTSDSWSAFGQVEVPLTENITAIGGLRYTKNKRDGLQRSATPFGPGAPDFSLFNPPSRKNFNNLLYGEVIPVQSADDKITWLAGVNYEPDPDTLIYAKVSTGFKAGGFNQGEDANGDPVPSFDPETNTAYEAGLKKNFGSMGQHLFNLTGFYYDYAGLQVSTIVNTEDGTTTYNAGSATLWGVEAEAAFELTENNFVSFTANYLSAELNDLFASYNVMCIDGPGCDDITSVPVFPAGDPDNPNPGTNYSGNRPSFAPKWILTARFEHVFDLDGRGTVTFSADTTYNDGYFTTFRNLRDEGQKSFTQTDLQIRYESEQENWDISAFVRNIENERPLQQGYFIAAGPDDAINWSFGTPRLYGIRVGYQF